MDKNNFAPRVGVTYDLGGGKSVIRGGYGRFYDKTHLELIGGLWTATPFTNSFNADVPDGRRRSRAAQRPVPDRSVPGQRADHQLRAAEPAVSWRPACCATQAPTWDNPDRRSPHTDQYDWLRASARRQTSRSRADYVHSQQPRHADGAEPEPAVRRERRT